MLGTYQEQLPGQLKSLIEPVFAVMPHRDGVHGIIRFSARLGFHGANQGGCQRVDVRGWMS